MPSSHVTVTVSFELAFVRNFKYFGTASTSATSQGVGVGVGVGVSGVGVGVGVPGVDVSVGVGVPPPSSDVVNDNSLPLSVATKFCATIR
ncbi:MAG: hypothetical protein CV087_06110 [Candidatus Brocadia sp. WS118]|nr:MAG: hypothetical protein CV087_06110 [Candidatus Brocadia sp. WS118]